MRDPYSVLGISPGADEETIKKAYRQKCKEFHPDLHPNDPTAEDKFKEVQAAYSEIMRGRQGGHGNARGTDSTQGSYRSSYTNSGYSGQNQQYSDPFGFGGFGFDPFGFGFGGYSTNGGYSAQGSGRDTPEMQAANNYIRNGYYQEALNVLNGIAETERTARWHYYAALANAGLGNNIRAQSEARMAADMEPGNYEYQNLLERLQNPGRAYSAYRQTQAQPRTNPLLRFCATLWIFQILLTCCCGRGGWYFCC